MLGSKLIHAGKMGLSSLNELFVNHDKTQQTTNHVHNSWDVLYMTVNHRHWQVSQSTALLASITDYIGHKFATDEDINQHTFGNI